MIAVGYRAPRCRRSSFAVGRQAPLRDATDPVRLGPTYPDIVVAGPTVWFSKTALPIPEGRRRSPRSTPNIVNRRACPASRTELTLGPARLMELSRREEAAVPKNFRHEGDCRGLVNDEDGDGDHNPLDGDDLGKLFTIH